MAVDQQSQRQLENGSKSQLSLQYGAKYVNETIDDHDYSGFTDLCGLEGRYDLTKKYGMSA